MQGTSDRLFSPNNTTTRAMVVTILYRLAGSPDLSNENLGYPFADVDASSWYGDAVYWARLNGNHEWYQQYELRSGRLDFPRTDGGSAVSLCRFRRL